MRRAAVLPAACVAVVLSLTACAEVPEPAEAVPVPALHPAVGPDQAEQVRARVQQRLLDAREAADPGLVATAATGPAAELQALAVGLAGPQDEATAVEPLPAGVLVAPQVDGWPRWFAVVTDPGAAAQELPVMEVYASPQVRSPYRLWARLTMLPGAELPAFDAAEAGSESLGDGPVAAADVEPGASGAQPSGAPSQVPSQAPSQETSEEPSDEPADAPSVASEESPEEGDDLGAALADLAERYASVMTDGAASPSAAQFQPDAFVTAVRARAEAEQAAVAAVASTTVEHEPYGGGDVLFAARAAGGDVLAVTAVTTTTTMSVRGGAGELRPGPEVAAAAGIEQTTGTLTTRSVAALAFVVPAEQGAIRLVAVGEGLVSAEATR